MKEEASLAQLNGQLNVRSRFANKGLHVIVELMAHVPYCLLWAM